MFRTFRELDEDLESLENGKTITKYIMATDESGKLSGIAESIHVAIIEYQLSQQQETYEHVLSLMVSCYFSFVNRDNELKSNRKKVIHI